MDLAPEQKLHGFTVRTREELPEIDGTAYVLDHDKSGAQLLYLRNDDNNKAFSIAFKTPPADDTGVFHILEHSVLCGSDKFPVKEPFDADVPERHDLPRQDDVSGGQHERPGLAEPRRRVPRRGAAPGHLP